MKRGRGEKTAEEKKFLRAAYESMNGHFGDLGWWPAETPFEVIVGAILTQNTAWRNVAVAIGNIKSAGLMSVEGIMETDDETLAELIRPSGYYRIKTRRLKSFVGYLKERYEGDLNSMFAVEWRELRGSLLDVKGIGRETADSILLYAGGKPVFVVDAYTKRILSRHGMVGEHADYDEIQTLFMEYLPGDAGLYNQYHALIVNTGKAFCLKKVPRCEICPLKGMVFGKRRA
jgi:endonuclease-3 related protein